MPKVAVEVASGSMSGPNSDSALTSSNMAAAGLSFGNTAWTAEQMQAIGKHLSRPIAPDLLSSREGPGGAKLVYVEGWKVPQLANKAFGFNGWSSSIQRFEVDVCERDKNGSFEVGLAAVVRITLKDGTHREDVGYGTSKNRSRSAAIDMARKSAMTDGLKRALKQFGPALGSNILDSTYVDFAKKQLKKNPYGRDYTKMNMLHADEVEKLGEPCYAGATAAAAASAAATASAAEVSAASARAGSRVQQQQQQQPRPAGKGTEPANDAWPAGAARPHGTTNPGTITNANTNRKINVGRPAAGRPAATTGGSASTSGPGPRQVGAQCTRPPANIVPIPKAKQVAALIDDDEDDAFNMCSQDLEKVDELCTAACSNELSESTMATGPISMSLPKRRRVGGVGARK